MSEKTTKYQPTNEAIHAHVCHCCTCAREQLPHMCDAVRLGNRTYRLVDIDAPTNL